MSKPRPLWLRLLRGGLFALIAVVTLAALWLSIVSFQSRRDWARTKADLLARGEKLSLVEFAPAPIPDDQNFFADPLWEELRATEPVEIQGVRSHRPRLPAEQRRIAVLTNPLTAEELDELKRAFPEVTPGARSSMVSNLVTLAKDRPDAATQRAALEMATALAEPARPTLERILELAQRPGADPGFRWDDGFNATMEHLSPMIAAARYCQNLAMANLLAGNRPAARRWVDGGFSLSRIVSSSFLLDLLVRFSMTNLVTTAVNLGIERHLWTDEDLRHFELQLSAVDLMTPLPIAFATERAAVNQLFERLQGHPEEIVPTFRMLSGLTKQSGDAATPLIPPGAVTSRGYLLVYGGRDLAEINRLTQEWIDLARDAARNGLTPRRIDASPSHPPTGLISRILLPEDSTRESFRKWLVQAANTGDAVRMTRLACALERYRLKSHAYPAALDALVPEFLPALPPDVIAGQTFRYRRVDADRFDLWSVGWNETDDAGRVSPERGDLTSADWRWNQPPGPQK